MYHLLSNATVHFVHRVFLNVFFGSRRENFDLCPRMLKGRFLTGEYKVFVVEGCKILSNIKESLIYGEVNQKGT